MLTGDTSDKTVLDLIWLPFRRSSTDFGLRQGHTTLRNAFIEKSKLVVRLMMTMNAWALTTSTSQMELRSWKRSIEASRR